MPFQPGGKSLLVPAALAPKAKQMQTTETGGEGFFLNMGSLYTRVDNTQATVPRLYVTL